ncbi:hypothetical protein N5P37_010561 [Trichoderma harzianum]|nr:hypothetical protein N5P37_010561 [Trichoderma harzianum]
MKTASSDDLCTTFMAEWGITIDQFYAWNPAVGNNCRSLWPGTSLLVTASLSPKFVAWNTDVNPTTCDGFWPDYTYCVKTPTTSSSSKPPSTTSKPPTSTSKPPSSTSKPPASTSKPPSSTSKPSSTAKPSSTTTKVTAPGPTQSGIPAKCNKFAITQTGDGCESFATRNKITVAQLYSWNPVLENACKNFWAAEAYCIGVSA